MKERDKFELVSTKRGGAKNGEAHEGKESFFVLPRKRGGKRVVRREGKKLLIIGPKKKDWGGKKFEDDIAR